MRTVFSIAALLMLTRAPLLSQWRTIAYRGAQAFDGAAAVADWGYTYWGIRHDNVMIFPPKGAAPVLMTDYPALMETGWSRCCFKPTNAVGSTAFYVVEDASLMAASNWARRRWSRGWLGAVALAAQGVAHILGVVSWNEDWRRTRRVVGLREPGSTVEFVVHP